MWKVNTVGIPARWGGSERDGRQEVVDSLHADEVIAPGALADEPLQQIQSGLAWPGGKPPVDEVPAVDERGSSPLTSVVSTVTSAPLAAILRATSCTCRSTPPARGG